MPAARPTAAFLQALTEAGGPAAPATATAQLRHLAMAALDAARPELAQKRSGYDDPVPVLVAGLDADAAAGLVDGIAHADGAAPDPARRRETARRAAYAGALVAVLPVPAVLRADPDAATEREWALVAHAVGALADAAEALTAPAGPDDLLLAAADEGGHLALVLCGGADAAFAALAFDERAAATDRLRTRAIVVGAAVAGDPAPRPPIGPGHPLRVAEALARLGGDPADPSAADELDDLLGTVLGDAGTSARPHEDPDPARRVARRIAQRLSGMGKWGGFHTEFAHLPRGFAGNDRALATRVGEALLESGLLLEKPSVGQRHVYLNSRRAGDIHRLIDTGELPPELHLPAP